MDLDAIVQDRRAQIEKALGSDYPGAFFVHSSSGKCLARIGLPLTQLSLYRACEKEEAMDKRPVVAALLVNPTCYGSRNSQRSLLAKPAFVATTHRLYPDVPQRLSNSEQNADESGEHTDSR
jgi:hypothetical protein